MNRVMGIVFLLAAVTAAPACAADVGTAAAEFLRFGAGGAAAMSEAGGSVAQDASAMHWNPAGLAGSRDADLYLAHLSLPEQMSHEFVAVALPVAGGERGVAGYSMKLLRSGSIPKLDNAGNETGTFSATDMAHALGWARSWGGTRAGAAVEFVSQSIAGTSGSAFAASLGLQHLRGPWSGGLSVSHLGSGLKLGSESFPLPMTLRGGGGWTGLDGGLLLAGDVTTAKGRGERGHVGASYRLWPPRGSASLAPGSEASLRLGYTAGGEDADGVSGLAAGLGLAVRSFRADLSYQPFGRFGAAVQIGLGWRFL